MAQFHNNPRDDEPEDEEYVAFPGGIPKRWLGPAMTLLCSIAIVYVPWATWQTIRVGIAAGTPGVHIAKDVFHHLVLFAAAVSFLIVVGAKILERVMMYYLQAKKRVEQAERRAEEAEQRAREAEQRAEQEHQLRLQIELQRQAERQRAEKAEQRAEEAENGKNHTPK